MCILEFMSYQCKAAACPCHLWSTSIPQALTEDFRSSHYSMQMLKTTKVENNQLTPPPPQPHPLLNSRPNPLHNLPIPPPPSAMNPTLLIPPLHRKPINTTPPPANLARDIIPAKTDVDAGGMLEQLRRRRPLVRLELPQLAGGEDGDDAVPVLGAEVGGCVDEDEAHVLLGDGGGGGGG